MRIVGGFSILLFLLLLLEMEEARRPHYYGSRSGRRPALLAKRKTWVNLRMLERGRGPRQRLPRLLPGKKAGDDDCGKFNYGRRCGSLNHSSGRGSNHRQLLTPNFGPYFNGIADRFNRVLTRVQYGVEAPECPKVPTETTFYCEPNAANACWSVGVDDIDCPDGSLCCFDGCKNVCYNPAHVEKEAEACPAVPSDSGQYCASSRPNCRQAGTPDSDCPNSGPCCFDGCHNRCLSDFPPPAPPSLPPIHYESNQEIASPVAATDHPGPANDISPGGHPTFQAINQREPAFILHIYGPPQTFARVASANYANLPRQEADEGHDANQSHQRSITEPRQGCPDPQQCVQASDVGLCRTTRSQCRSQLHDCSSSSDCRRDARCCFDGCANVCERDFAASVHSSLHDYFYGGK